MNNNNNNNIKFIVL